MMDSKEEYLLNLQAQQDECESMSAIFPDEFLLLSESVPDGDSEYGRRLVHPISYSVKIRPPLDQIADASLRPSESNFALRVTYPPAYPDVAPAFSIGYERSRPLHEVQERAIMERVYAAAESEGGMPCVMTCIYAAREFVEEGGFQSGLVHLLTDDNLSYILSYLATSKETIQGITEALPMFAAVAKTDMVWKQLCRNQWKHRWGFQKRWKRALEGEQRMISETDSSNCGRLGKNQYFWFERYQDEEMDSKRVAITADELCDLIFDYRNWFSLENFIRQPGHLRDVLPTGLKNSIATDFRFTPNGTVLSQSLRCQRAECPRWSLCVRAVAQVHIMTSVGSRIHETYNVHRLFTWGWELRSARSVMRAIDNEDVSASKCDQPDLWSDLRGTLMLQEKPEWILPKRTPYPYSYREVPDDEDLKNLLHW